jgi:Flp pilus assembly protein TadG
VGAWGQRGRRTPADSGAAAVEMALLLPILLTVVFGIIEFGFAFNAQISLTQATREAVRVGAIGEQSTEAMEARLGEAYNAVRAGPPVAEATVACDPDDTDGQANIRARIDYEPLIGWFGDGIPLRATAVMRCGG